MSPLATALLFVSLLPTPAFDLRALSRDEAALLHLSIKPADLAANLRIWEPRAGEWLATSNSDPPTARLLVCYLFSPRAAPTAGELPWLRKLATRVEAAQRGDVRFLFIAQSASAAEMKALIGSGSGPSLTSPYYLDPTSAIGEALRQSLPGAELPLPITLLLDERRVVRQVLIGALGDRRSELISGISDLLYQLRAASPGHPPPPSGKELRP